MTFARPTKLSDVLALKASGNWCVLAGGTDLYPATHAQKLRGNILDITGVRELRGIRESELGVEIGATTTWTDIINADLPAAFKGLKSAAREVGSTQIQNAATVVGNICNASPAADGVPPLLTLDAFVTISNTARARQLPLKDFIVGNRNIRIESDEIVTGLTIPRDSATGRSGFVKLGARTSLVISIAMAAVRTRVRNGVVEQAAISVGSCSEVAVRLHPLEQFISGLAVTDAISAVIGMKDTMELSPINDIRATATYRSSIVPALIQKALNQIPDFRVVQA